MLCEMRLRELAVCVFSISLCAIVVLRLRYAPEAAPAQVVPLVVTLVDPPAIVVAPAPVVVAPAPIVVAPAPPPPIVVDRASPLGEPPAEPGDEVVRAALTRQCAHPDPGRTEANVLALAAVATGTCALPPYESGAESREFCGRDFLDAYTVIACGRCLTYRWYEGSGWSLDEMHRAAADGDPSCH